MSAGRNSSKGTPVKWKPNDDGITHINIYSKGNTSLGVFMSNYTAVPVMHMERQFASIEALWYWLQVKDYVPPGDLDRLNRLCGLSGYAAKQLGKTLRDLHVPSTGRDRENAAFQTVIKGAIRQKFDAQPRMRQALIESGTLPLTHYYVQITKSGQVYATDAGHYWLVDFFHALRKEFQEQAKHYQFPPDEAFEDIPWPTGRQPSWGS